MAVLKHRKTTAGRGSWGFGTAFGSGSRSPDRYACRLMRRCIWVSLPPSLDRPFLRHLSARASESSCSSSSVRVTLWAASDLRLKKVACRDYMSSRRLAIPIGDYLLYDEEETFHHAWAEPNMLCKTSQPFICLVDVRGEKKQQWRGSNRLYSL